MNDRDFMVGAGGITLSFLIYWLMGHPFFITERLVMFLAIMTFSGTLMFFIRKARRGEKIFLRDIPGLKAVEEAVGRSTEMGKPVLYVPGIMDMDQVETVAGVMVNENVITIPLSELELVSESR